MTLTEAVVITSRLIEQAAIEQDFTLLQKLDFVKKQIMEHACRKPKKK